jgi:apolipoprotein N-acyltransferase
MKGKFTPVLFSLLSALLLAASWYWHLGILIFFAFVPLLLAEHRLSVLGGPRSRLWIWLCAYLCFLFWNVLVTWWVVYASFGGAMMAFICNALLMSIVFMIYSSIKKKIDRHYAPWFLIPLWIAWEHLHTLWDITWTWLTLGNVFAFHYQWVQWYELTGTSGGTLWILCVNVIVFRAINQFRVSSVFSGPILRAALAIIAPILFSYLIFYIRTKQPKDSVPVKVVVVQPNIDPYNEKFTTDYLSQFNKMLTLVRGKISEKTRYLILPETFITGIESDLNEEVLDQYPEIKLFRDSLIDKYPDLKIVTGGNTYCFYHDEKKSTATSRKDRRSGMSYDVFNSAIYIDRLQSEVYHKSKLVPGVERMPFPALFRPLEKFAIDMGGTMGSLGTQEERDVFRDNVHAISVAPVICYESVYADYVAGYIRKGANLIFIITNDGWWDNTPGYVQHLNYARLRAIENRRDIARCANTGVSCFIDRFGRISQPTSWWKEAVISQTLEPNTKMTFFSKFGDIISYTSVGLSILMLIWLVAVRARKKI